MPEQEAQQAQGLQEPTEEGTVEETATLDELGVSTAVPWDEFIGTLDKEPEAEAAESTEEATPEATPQVTEPEAEAAKAAEEKPVEAAEPAVPTAEAPEPVTYPTFSFKGDGQQFEIPGSQQRDEGVFIPTDQVEWLQKQLATAKAHYGSWQGELQKARSEGQQLREEAEAKIKGADLITERLQALAEGPEDDFIEWAQNYRRNLPTLLAEARAAELEARNTQLEQRANAGAQQEQQAALAQQLDQGLDLLVDQYAPAYPDVPRDKVRTRLGRLRHAIFYPAADNDPQGRWQKGEILADYGLVEDEFKEMQEIMATQQKPVTSAAKANQDAMAQPTAPPVPAKGNISTPAPPKPRTFKTAQEQEDYLLSNQAVKDIQKRIAALDEQG